ncbi:MAG: phage portal protein [Oscillospiraceae bacterium]|nr:phage portal protein [Oscillospiraceae bacterium]
MALWQDIYSGSPPWQYVRRSGLYGRGERRMAMLGCAKVLCDSLAALTFGTQADIYCADDAQREYVLEVLQKNSFWENMPSFFSRAYALGGGVLKVYSDGEEIRTDYVDADMFIPLSASNGAADGGIFCGAVYSHGERYTLLERHLDGKVDRYVFDAKGREADCEAVTGLEQSTGYGAGTGFAYFKPSVTNPDGQSLYGMSVIDGCIDTLRAIDTVFDSFTREFILGRKRIIVPSSCIRTVVDPETGKVSRYFDTDDEVYQALKCDEDRELKITDNTTELRVTEHRDALNALLDVLCFQTGLSAGTLSFTAGGLKTAAEVKSMEQRTEITMQQNRFLAAELIERTAMLISRCGIETGAIKSISPVRAVFADSQTLDREKTANENIRLYEAGLRSRTRAVMEINDCSADEARQEEMLIDRERRYDDERE